MGTHAGMRGRDGKVRRRYFMAKYVMALDAGTTSNRCILFNEKGEICSMAQKEFTQYYPQPGWVEHDASEIWQTQLSVARMAMQNVGATYKDIAAIGITNQRETVIVWDKQTGQPVWRNIRTSPTALITKPVLCLTLISPARSFAGS